MPSFLFLPFCIIPESCLCKHQDLHTDFIATIHHPLALLKSRAKPPFFKPLSVVEV